MATENADDIRHMARALQLARLGRYTTSPNPRVGCVLVRDGQVIGEGYHLKAGEPHAEVNALRQAGDARGATAYVTLEPCAHFGRTPPCAQGLIDAGVARVVAGMRDPNPLVAGKGVAMLEAAGIHTLSGVLEAEARALNPGFIKRMETGLPYVRVKLAASLDGRTAMASGESQWITGPEARRDVQTLRARSCAIVTGIGTVLADDCALNVRYAEADLPAQATALNRQPLRVVVDSALRTPPTAKILAPTAPVLLATAGSVGTFGEHVEVLALSDAAGRVDLRALLETLAARQCNEVLVEAGPALAGAFVAAGLVDEIVLYQATTLLGSDARPLLALSLQRMSEQHRLACVDVRQVGADLRMTLRPQG